MPRLAKKMEEQLLNENPDLRDQGLVPVLIWLPDPGAPGLAEEAREQSLRAARSPGEKEAIDFIEAVADWPAD
jgi:hypothetical protein